MKLNKPKFWDKKNSLISILLFPFSLVVSASNLLKKKFTKPVEFNIPIICIGNIYIGGTGKTPASILLANEFLKLGRNPVILKKYYKDHSDEHNLIREHFKNFILSQNRIDGIRNAEKANYDCVILDDGFQDCKIKKDLIIVCFSSNQLIGNGYALPSGPLRENLSSLIDAHIVLINGSKDDKFEQKILNINKELEIFYSNYKPTNIDQFENKKLLALAGIGNPDNFFQLMEKNNLDIKEKLIFPDHYQFTKKEVENIVEVSRNKNYQIIMTEKDFFRIKDYNIEGLKYLKVSLEINDKDRFIKRLNRLYDKKI